MFEIAEGCVVRMAAGNSKTNSKKKTESAGAGNKKSTKKASTTVQQNEKEYRRQEREARRERSHLEEPVRIEIIMTITALVSVLLILSYVNLCGVVGTVINQLLFGLMGVFTYVFPFVLFFFVAFYLSNRSNRVAKQKLLAGLAFLFLLTGLIQLISGIDANRKFFDYYIYCSENKCGGGVFGAAIAMPLAKLFGTVATAVIIAALMIVFLLNTLQSSYQKSLLNFYLLWRIHIQERQPNKIHYLLKRNLLFVTLP